MRLLTKVYSPDFLLIIEPQISGDRATTVCNNLGYGDVIRVDAEGRSGSIWLAWRSYDFQIQLIDASQQHVTVKVSNNTQREWLLTGVYGSPNYRFHHMLWNHLIEFGRSLEIPWLVTGDFNAYYSPSEKAGTVSTASLRRCQQFTDWINEANLFDLGFSGAQYTWCRRDSNNSFKASRIDRSLCNSAWNAAFANTSTRHLPKLHSDHLPILTSYSGLSYNDGGAKPFRFEAAWLLHNNFSEFSAENWNVDGDFNQGLKDISTKLQEWNRLTFGIIGHCNKRLLARIQGVQTKIATSPSPGLFKLQAKLEKELDDLLAQEEIIWFQRAKETWVKLGEMNTSYFHQQANRRRRRNKIISLRNHSGEWVEDPAQLRDLIVSFFRLLYTQDELVYSDLMPKNCFPRIKNKDLLTLLRPFQINDFHRAIFDMKPYAAPGPDGFQAIFYQKMWSLVGKGLTHMAVKFFETGEIEEEALESTVVLIPKTESPAQFRPICLNNVRLKVITKAITNRIKPLMKNWVAPTQNSFITGRQTTDNILILQEAIHSFRKKKKRGKGGLVIKIDLEKSYDRLRWDFIRDTLAQLGLPSTWISRIMFCVERNKMRINWNGELTEQIIPTRGVRQGDPLSPYLFVLCMERLSHRIQQAVTKKLWKPLQLSKNGPKISHLFFADDFFLFAEAEGRQIDIIRKCLDDFCSSSGQKVNLSKSTIMISPNVSRDRRQRLENRAGIPTTTDLGKYLGIHTINGRVSKARYKELTVRIQKHLANWKTRHLSIAAQMTLVHSISSSMSVYPMFTEQLPTSVCSSIDRINRQFIWGMKKGSPVSTPSPGTKWWCHEAKEELVHDPLDWLIKPCWRKDLGSWRPTIRLSGCGS
ncbi:unnamed protein product [Linum trigynum]|uniref:Reverse transcriptase domain-containing protein n=1 Tax=Linum trigynum TaxID=586398 RepID=A0AAV2GRX4_9ROSI